MPINRTLEAMRTHRHARNRAGTRDLAQLAMDDLHQKPPMPDANGVVAYSGERAIAQAFRTAEDQKLYWRSETVTAGIAAVLFLVIAVAVPVIHYFNA